MLTTNQLRSQFNNQVHSASDQPGRPAAPDGGASGPAATASIASAIRRAPSAPRSGSSTTPEACCAPRTRSQVRPAAGLRVLRADRAGTLQQPGTGSVVASRRSSRDRAAWVLYARAAFGPRAHARPGQFFLLLGVLGGAVPRAAGRPGHRAAGDAPDRRADRRRPRDRAHPRPEPPPAAARRPRTRWPSWRARSRGCSARSTPPAATPRRCSSASGSSSPTPRTSCARR